VGFNKVALVQNFSHSFMTVIRRPALPFSVVWRPLMALLAQQLVPLCLRVTLAHRPPHLPTHPPPYVTLVIFCATSEKDSEKLANQIAGNYIIIC